jgi:ATP synthase assembly factor FMC1
VIYLGILIHLQASIDDSSPHRSGELLSRPTVARGIRHCPIIRQARLRNEFIHQKTSKTSDIDYHNILHHHITMPAAAPSPATLRSLYRSFLRELPPRALSRTSRTPLQSRIRESISSPGSSTSSSPISVDHADQFLQYARAQRIYATLLERYNPGMNMEEEDRVRMTARRVGMDLPEEFAYVDEEDGNGNGNGNGKKDGGK